MRKDRYHFCCLLIDEKTLSAECTYNSVFCLYILFDYEPILLLINTNKAEMQIFCPPLSRFHETIKLTKIDQLRICFL